MADCDTLKRHIRIETVIGRVVPLTRHGHWLSGRCPFHADSHPSLIVWPQTGTWKCMTCSPMRDDVIGFVRQWQRCSTAEALRWLSQDAVGLSTHAVPAPARPALPLASVDDRHATYQTLLQAWGLTDSHRAALHARGLTDAAIARAGFASVAPGWSPVTPRGEGIPGFARRRQHWHIVGPAGIAIPVRNRQRQIVAVHVRADHVDHDHGKYRWLSTPPPHVGGAASGAPVHVVRGVDQVVWITEGPLKAIVAQARLRHTVLGVPGVGAWAPVLEIVAALRPTRIILAFDRDADPQTADKVAQQVDRLAGALTDGGWPWMTAQWEGPKGLDDALVAGASITFRPSA